jgi:hypothetical protein
MNKIKFYAGILLVAVFALTACERIMNEKSDLGSLTPDEVWNDQTLILRFLDNTMANGTLPTGGVASGETEEFGGNSSAFLGNNYSGTPSGLSGWWNYANMRSINTFLANIENVPNEVLSKSDRESYQGQMLVLRAWNYWLGVNAYGGVPLILTVQDMPEDPKTLGVPRSKTSECIEQILADLNAAIELEGFPLKWTDDANAGRLSKSIAYVLKAKVLLNYASPRFTKETPAGTKSKEQRWQDAYQAWNTAKTVLDGQGFGLFRGGHDKSFDDAVQDYYDMFIGNEIPNNPEMIWVSRRDRNAWATGPGGPYSRNGSVEWAGPSLQLVSHFLNADGSVYTGLDPLFAELDALPVPGMKVEMDKACEVPYWQGREPRFYATVVYNGCIWPVKRRNPYVENEVPEQHQWFFEFAPEASPYDNPLQTKSINATGFAIRKLQNVDQDWENDPRGDDQPIVRYAEVLLSLAECAAMTGKEAEAVGYLKQIRQRAGIPSANNYGLGLTPPTGEALLLTILNERAVEFAYEANIRFGDLHRWRLYTDELAGFKLNGKIWYTLGQEMKVFNPLEDRDEYATVLYNFPDINVPGNETEYYRHFNDRVYALKATPISVAEREYFWCIPYEEHIVKNPVIEQTRGWDDPRGSGTFDPYQ